MADNYQALDAAGVEITFAADEGGGAVKTPRHNIANVQALAEAFSAEMKDGAQPVSGPLTDAQLRATAVPVSGPLTDTQLRATAVPVSVSGVATATNQTAGNTLLGAVTETAPASDTASSGLNGRLQRIAQRITTFIGLLPSSIGAKNAAGSLSVTTATDDPVLSRVGATNEAAAGSDTATSGLNGLLKRVAQRLTTVIAAVNEGTVPLSALVSGNVANTDGSSTAVIAAQGSGIQTYLTDITLTNSSDTGVLVEIKDGSTTRWSAFVPAESGITHRFASPLVGTANTAWNVDAAAATTTIYASFSGFRVSA